MTGRRSGPRGRAPSGPLALAALLLVPALAGCLDAGPAEPSADPSAGGSLLACPAPCTRLVAAWPDDAFAFPSESTLAADPLDPRHLVAASMVGGRAGDALNSWAFLHESRDGGETWETARFPGGPTAGTEHPLATSNSIGDPSVVFLPDGTLVFSGLAFDDSAVGRTAYTAFAARSSDGDLSYRTEDIRVVAQGEGAVVFGVGAAAWRANDKQWIATGPDESLLMAWTQINAPLVVGPVGGESVHRDEMFAASTDGGRSWSAPALVDAGGWHNSAAPGILSNGDWLVAYLDFEHLRLKVARSIDRGASWNLTEIGPADRFPVVAVSRLASGDRVYLAYPEPVDPGTPQDPFATRPLRPVVRWSDDGGATWTTALALDEPEQRGRTFVALDARSDGSAVVTFFHHVGDEPDADAELRAVAIREGAIAGRSAIGSANGPPEGDYAGVAALPGGGAIALWTTRRGDDIPAAVVAARVDERP